MEENTTIDVNTAAADPMVVVSEAKEVLRITSDMKLEFAADVTPQVAAQAIAAAFSETIRTSVSNQAEVMIQHRIREKANEPALAAAMENLRKMADEALAQYNKETFDGGEPFYPQWINDLNLLLEVFK